MPLIEQTMTEKNLEAHQRNAQQSHGAATPEGKERARAANLQHGYYSEKRDQALVALGEDPAALAALAEGARQQFRPANAYQEWTAGRIASLQWRIQRAERQQESKAVARIRKAEAKRRESARELRERCDHVAWFLDILHRAAARPDFYTPPGCFEICRQVTAEDPTPPMDQIMDLLHQLRRPARFSRPLPPPLADAMSDKEWEENSEGDETDESAVPDPDIPVAEGRDRDPLREELWKLAGQERRSAMAQWQKEIAGYEAPLSAYARDLLVAEIGKDLELLRREERSCSRELARLTKELTQLRNESVPAQKEDGARDRRANSTAAEVGAGASPAGSDSEVSPLTPPGGPDALSVAPGSTRRRSETAPTTPGTATSDMHENAGASGYAYENTCEQPRAVSTKHPSAPTQDPWEAGRSHDVLTEPSQASSGMARTGVLPANGRAAASANPRHKAA